jgi:hypothetical protein
LRKITNYVFVPGDTKYNVNLIDKAIEIKALTVDDQSILHDLRKKRNKIAHEETSDVILTEEEIEKIKCILSKIEKFGK